jgi:hypothetical protein
VVSVAFGPAFVRFSFRGNATNTRKSLVSLGHYESISIRLLLVLTCFSETHSDPTSHF